MTEPRVSACCGAPLDAGRCVRCGAEAEAVDPRTFERAIQATMWATWGERA